MPNLPNSEDRFPNCLRIELKVVPVLSGNLLKKTKQIDLVLNIRFGEHKEQFSFGSVTFGLKCGELKIKLTNGEVPLENIKLKKEFRSFVEKKVQIEQSKDNQVGVKGSVNPGFNVSGQQTNKKSIQFQEKEYQIRTEGTKDKPIWIFEVKSDNEILQGMLQNTVSATINIISKPCIIESIFTIKPQYLCITEAKWLWQKNIKKKRITVIERAIVRHFIDKKLNEKPYLSRVELQYA